VICRSLSVLLIWRIYTLCRQYLNETEVWAGLVVEVVRQLEQQLGWWQRRWLALRFHWRKSRMLLLLRLVLPLFAVLAVVATVMAYGIAKLNEHSTATAREKTVSFHAVRFAAYAGPGDCKDTCADEH
jgi:hypothetical protein